MYIYIYYFIEACLSVSSIETESLLESEEGENEVKLRHLTCYFSKIGKILGKGMLSWSLPITNLPIPFQSFK